MDKIAKIAPGYSTKKSVQVQLGSPSTKSFYGDEAWFYMFSQKESIAFLKPKLVKQEVVKISFNNNGVVKDIQRYNKDDARVVAFSKDKTPTEGDDLTIVQQLLGNVGRFNPDAIGGPSAPGRR